LENNIADILLSDMNMPHMNGIDLTLQVRQGFPEVKVLMLTVSEDVAVIRAAYQAM
jgi:DNA-binding NarL/FixJ family response regulator